MEFLEAKIGEDFHSAKILFKNYFDELRHSLGQQDFDSELLNINELYTLPKGLLILARLGEDVVGCIGLKKLSNEDCEMKRLYIKQDFRGFGLGRKLINELILRAKSLGFKRLLLDTLPELKSAIILYKQFGFREIVPYYDSVISEPIFMGLEL